MLHKVLNAMARENDYSLEGEVEIDESFAGGKMQTDIRIIKW